MKRFLKPGWLFLYAIFLVVLIKPVLLPSDIELNETIRLSEHQTIHQLYDIDYLTWGQVLSLKRFMRKHDEDVRTIQPGAYVFSGSYTPSDILETFLAGPQQVYERITVLEGWSMYDIDDMLVEKGYISAGEYIAFVTDSEIIARYIQRYSFLAQAREERPSLASLEGYLYPDTYFIDLDKHIIDQLLYLQLEGFKQKIWEPYGDALLSLSNDLQNKGYNFSLSTYGALILASIIEKEERYDPNKIDIASVFYNRLHDGMRIDADISLCYGIRTGYDICTPEVIVQHLYDASNPYNTRAVKGLPPTPITSPTVASVRSLIDAEKTENYYYLHDNQGNLHTASSLAGHNENKRLYLQ